MSKTMEAFGEAKGSARPFSERILESMRAGEDCARQVCDLVRDFNDPVLLAALRESFQFFLKGAISLHRRGRHSEFWKGPPEEVQTNFCAQAMQLCAVVHIARFLEATHVRMEWQELASKIPSDVRPGYSITPQVARQFVALFAHAAGPDHVLERALPRVLPDLMDLNDSLRALSIKPFQGLEIQEQGNEPSISGGSSDEKYQKDRESAIPEPCVA